MISKRRTDMAAELINDIDGELTLERGISVRTIRRDGFDVTDVEVLSEEGAKLLGRDIGCYYTLSLPPYSFDLSDCENLLIRLLCEVFPKECGSAVVAALGNADITPDALGPLTASGLLVTRHLSSSEFPYFTPVSLCRPGVLGTSGIESSQQVAAFCSLVKPSFVIVVDALACREADTLCRSIQISSTGIAPGSGVGNDRKRICEETLGVPVIAVGVPTVIDAGSLFESSAAPLFVTSRDIDSKVRIFAHLISRALNLALHPKLSREDIETLLG